MDKFVIRGGNPLLGTVRISGAKNAALPCIAAALLTEEPVVLENIPQVRDIETTRNLLAAMGADVELGYGRAQHRTTIHCENLAAPEASYELVKTMRASTLVLGPLVARCAREPEVADLADLLNKMGANIEGAGTPTIRVKGVAKLKGAKHRIIPDRIEAGTFIIAGAMTGGDLNVSGCEPKHLGALLSKLKETGVKTKTSVDAV